MKRKRFELLARQRGLRARGQRDQRLLLAVQAQQQHDAQSGDGEVSGGRVTDARLAHGPRTRKAPTSVRGPSTAG